MSAMASEGDLGLIMSWVKGGAVKAEYEDTVQPIIEANSLDCHDGSNPHLSNLDGFENIQSVVDQDTGCIAADVSSWYFSKVYSGSAWVVLIAGGLMGLSFAVMWITSMYQMWFYHVPGHVSGRHQDLVD